MIKIASILLEWKYEPSNYFKAPISISEPGVEISISDGLAKATIDTNIFKLTSTFEDDLTKIIESRLFAVQIITHSDFSLTGPNRSDFGEDGKKLPFMRAGTGHFRDTFFPIESHYERQERANKERWFAEIIAQYRSNDIILDQILHSYRMAVKDSGNELVRLYEIRDALTGKFNNEKSAREKLGIIKQDWNLLGDLANNQPLKQGRHRGKSAGLLRDATTSELNSARKIAKNLIEKYLHYLENNNP
jgi:hypothetical protein